MYSTRETNTRYVGMRRRRRVSCKGMTEVAKTKTHRVTVYKGCEGGTN